MYRKKMYFCALNKKIPFNMKNQGLIFTVIFIVLLSIGLDSCNKKKEEKAKSNPKTPTKEFVLPQGIALGDMKLKDSQNNIHNVLYFLVAKDKENRVNLEPINTCMSKIMDDFKLRVNNQGDKTKESFLEIKPYYFQLNKDLYSCLLRIRFAISCKDTLTEYKAINYSLQNNKNLSFDDVFSITESNLKAFLTLIEHRTIKLSELKRSDFNIEQDSISFNIIQSQPINKNIQKRYKQSIDKLKPFIKPQLAKTIKKSVEVKK
ncbi:MAG: hypothetical protein H6Q15_1787 [Bacteroidetes bacterium]|nr:hypothetical protein [Bacteroidota bacterium]